MQRSQTAREGLRALPHGHIKGKDCFGATPLQQMRSNSQAF